METTNETQTTKDGNVLSSVLCGKPVDDGEKLHRHGYQAMPQLTTHVYSKYYEMKRQRGFCVIFNHKHFARGLSKRDGTDRDRNALKHCFEQLGYVVKVYDDLSYQLIERKLTKFATSDHTSMDSFVCCVLTHGDDGFLHAKDRPYTTDRLYTPFRGDQCPSLAGKPKMFFIQACQGTIFEEGVCVSQASDDSTDQTDSASLYSLPRMADILIALSTVPGYFSWRDKQNGSWFIQHLVHALNENRWHGGREDILSILTTVNCRVAYDCEVKAKSETTTFKQMPCFLSSLTRKVTFPVLEKSSEQRPPTMTTTTTSKTNKETAVL